MSREVHVRFCERREVRSLPATHLLLGVIGSKQEAIELQARVEQFLHSVLRLEVAEEKSGVHHAEDGVVFLGYDVRRWGRNGGCRMATRSKRASRHVTVATPSHTIQLSVPDSVPSAFATRKKYGDLNRLLSHQRAWMASLTDTEIVMAYNAEMRGLANYYCLAWNVRTALNKLHYLWWGSLLRTLALKHKTTTTKVATHLRSTDGEYVVNYVVRGKRHQTKVFKLKHLGPAKPHREARVDADYGLALWINSRSDIVARLNARDCEACGAADQPVEIHHVRRLADVKDAHLAVKLRAARTRKRFVLCRSCHHALHAGCLTSPL